MPTGLLNPRAGVAVNASPDRAPRDFHRRLPGYQPTPLVDAPAIAERLGIGRLWVKDESSRMGLPSFKVLGASWATFRALEGRAGQPLREWEDVAELGSLVRRLTPVRRLAAATDGNHGRAVARTARWLGLEAHIYVPVGMATARVEAIVGEGASVTTVDGSYDAAVAQSALEADDHCLVISDTSWPGYTSIPSWVIEGYSTIFDEVDADIESAGVSAPDLVVVQIGVGALAAAVVRHFRQASTVGSRILGVEPTGAAACVMASMQDGGIRFVPGPHRSIMAGLNAGTPSIVAWPDVSSGIDAFIAIEDDWAREGMRLLASMSLVSGETGAAGIAGLLAVRSGELASIAAALELTEDSSILVLSTEGATDPDAYHAAVGTDRPRSA
ncbi:MAG: diaminopropionate ammonia-lyase [Geodermatophilaceae bacterium]|nr:diaminopropionate ammonia-lyase [Geodermatophilaceae bacterium]